MRVDGKKVILEQGDFILEYASFNDEPISHLLLVDGVSSMITACGLQYRDGGEMVLGNPNRCLRCQNSPFHNMRR